MNLTIGQAAKIVGRAKSTISKECSNGKLSHTKNDDGSFSIDASELRRVYPDAFDENGEPKQSLDAPAVSADADETVELRIEVATLRERLRMMETQSDRERARLLDEVADLRAQRDAEGEERRKLTAILTDQRTAATEAAADRPGLLARIMGLPRKSAAA